MNFFCDIFILEVILFLKFKDFLFLFNFLIFVTVGMFFKVSFMVNLE